ncbi:MAG: hypothetical protein K2I33_00715, partial [Oscillospiraceae bacterium]|nr:hypothetical protein [Oscillospiraceae bacterium]
LSFIGFCIYGFFSQKSVVKSARRIDARVISCEEKILTEFSYNLVTVDFYGLNGEIIVKTIKSKKKYKAGELIPSLYLDKKDSLWLDTDNRSINRNSSKLLMVIGFLAVFLAAVLAIVYLTYTDQTELFKTIFGYIISIVFVGIGIKGIRKKLNLKNSIDNMQVIEGTQVDYYTVKGRKVGEPSVYSPIYEFAFMGKLLRYQSNVRGSRKKYRTIGRKVHILIDSETQKIMCKEDSQTSSSTYILFGVIGVLVLCIMLAVSFGLL